MGKKKHAISDSRLMNLWRKAVLINWNYTDPLYPYLHNGAQWRDTSGESLQCHHYVGRRKLLTRWSYKNGVPLTVESHQFAHTGRGNEILRSLMDVEWLDAMERITAKDYFAHKGMTDDEYRVLMMAELKGIIGGYDD